MVDNRDLWVPGTPNYPTPNRDANSRLSVASALLNERLENAGQSIVRALMAPGTALQGGYNQRPVFADGRVGQFDPRMMDDAANLAGIVSMGSMPAPRPANSIGMGGAARAGIEQLDDYARSVGVDLSVSQTPSGVVLSKIVVPENLRSQGLGTDVMRRILAYADEASVPVALTPSSDFGGNLSSLRKFYQRLGFVPNAGRNKDFAFRETMIRNPGGR